jgi:hypothetical protein
MKVLKNLKDFEDTREITDDAGRGDRSYLGIKDLSERLSMKLNALTVTSGLPGPCRSRLEKYSQIRLKSNS